MYINNTIPSFDYHPPLYLSNGHLQTIIPAMFRRSSFRSYQERIRISLPDEDFIDIDMHYSYGDSIVILLHGLESSSHSIVMRGMAQALIQKGYSIAAINFRGCSGEVNKKLKSYHSGFTDDVHEVLQFIRKNNSWKKVFAVGFSLGGNVLLHLLHEFSSVSEQSIIQKAACISVPMHLESCAYALAKAQNILYMQRFIRKYKNKVHAKRLLVEQAGYSMKRMLDVHSFIDIDEVYTAPVHGYDSAQHYWDMCSTLEIVEKISIETIIINALDDPFLTNHCFPIISNSSIQTIYPAIGGHLGFIESFLSQEYWYESIITSFFDATCNSVKS